MLKMYENTQMKRKINRMILRLLKMFSCNNNIIYHTFSDITKYIYLCTFRLGSNYEKIRLQIYAYTNIHVLQVYLIESNIKT